jgi:hypothetical protein
MICGGYCLCAGSSVLLIALDGIANGYTLFLLIRLDAFKEFSSRLKTIFSNRFSLNWK